MGDSCGVDVLQSSNQLQQDLLGQFLTQWDSCSRFQESDQIRALGLFHQHVDVAIVLPIADQSSDAWMLQQFSSDDLAFDTFFLEELALLGYGLEGESIAVSILDQADDDAASSTEDPNNGECFGRIRSEW